MRYSQDAILEKIARVLGITEGATKARLYRGWASVRLALESTWTSVFRQPGHSGKGEESSANGSAGQRLIDLPAKMWSRH
jgi:hypothetical protein